MSQCCNYLYIHEQNNVTGFMRPDPEKVSDKKATISYTFIKGRLRFIICNFQFIRPLSNKRVIIRKYNF